jgi:hypothetical protein
MVKNKPIWSELQLFGVGWWIRNKSIITRLFEKLCEGGGSHQFLSIHHKRSRIQLPNEPKIVKIGEVSREFVVGNWQQERGGEEGRAGE